MKNYMNFVQGIKSGKKSTEEKSPLLKSTFQNTKVNFRQSVGLGAGDSSTHARSSLGDEDVEARDVESPDEEPAANDETEEDECEVLEYSDVTETIIEKEQEEEADAQEEEGSVTMAASAAFQEDGWIG
jgi:hypothetical protein